MAYQDFWSMYDEDPIPYPGGPDGPTNPGGPGGPAPPPATPTPDDYGGTKGDNVFDWNIRNNPPGSGMDEGGSFPTFGGASRFNFNIGAAPRFTAPQFTAPTLGEAENEPGFAHSLDTGRRALESSASARGTLNTGGTLKGVLEYGQRLGQQNYQNVFNRALSTFDRLYTGKLDEYKPLLTEWGTRAAGGQRAAELSWMREMDLYRAQIDRWRHQTPSASDIIQLETSTL